MCRAFDSYKRVHDIELKELFSKSQTLQTAPRNLKVKVAKTPSFVFLLVTIVQIKSVERWLFRDRLYISLSTSICFLSESSQKN